MTTTLIEKCLALETFDALYYKELKFIFITKSALVDIKDLKNMDPGIVLRLKTKTKIEYNL